jgi:hypothetical protein
MVRQVSVSGKCLDLPNVTRKMYCQSQSFIYAGMLAQIPTALYATFKNPFHITQQIFLMTD